MGIYTEPREKQVMEEKNRQAEQPLAENVLEAFVNYDNVFG